MYRWIKIASLMTITICISALPACSKKPADSSKVRIGIVTNCSDPFWDLCEAGAKKAASEFDVDLIFRQPDKQDAATQKPIIDTWVNQGIEGIAVSVINSEAQAEYLRNVAGKVKLITMDNDSPGSNRLCFVGVNNREAGRAVGRMIKKALPNGGTLALFIGNTTSTNGVERPGGLYEELATPDANGKPGTHPTNSNLSGKFYGKYFVVDGECKTDSGDKEAAINNASAMLNRIDGLPDICMVGLYAYNPPAILKAVSKRTAGSTVKIIGFDEDLVTLEAIEIVDILGTVVQDPYNYGYQSVAILAASIRGDDSKLTKDLLAYQVVTKEGGPEEVHNGLKIKNIKSVDYTKKVKDAFLSVGK